jgi:hypothetical protein
MAEIRGGSTGLVYKDFKGGANRLVTRIDPTVIALAAKLRANERQAAEELRKSPSQGFSGSSTI